MTALPQTLIDAVREQRAVLFLGSGASHGSKHPEGKKVPLGNALRDMISDQFLGGKLKDKPLTAVSAMAANEVGLRHFQKFIHDLFEPFQPSDHHLLIPKFRWKAIATTNYDLIIERAYAPDADPLQEIVRTVKDGDLLETRLSKVISPLPYYKLHGCIDHYTDESIPLILSNEQYASYEKNRIRFFNRFRDLGYEYPIVFVGYSIADPHIQRILFDLTAADIGRPMYYNVAPGIDDIEARYWATHRIACVDASFETLLTSLDAAIPSAARKIPIAMGGGSLSIRTHYKIASAAESPTLRAYLETDATHVHSAMAAEPQDAAQFYRGYDKGWGAIQQNLDAKRSFTDSVLVDAVLVSDEGSRPADLFMLKGPAGNGKSVALKRIAWEAAANYEQLVIYANNAAALRIEPIEEIHRLTGKRILLCVDHVALHRIELVDLLRSARSKDVELSIIGTERDNEWNIYCDNLEMFVKQEFPVRYLNEREIDDLIGLLDRHRALGLLTDKDHDERVYAFATSAGRQLLVALHEVTLGVPFEDIVLDEFNRIEPPAARTVYLSICALHQFGAPVRAGLISRSSGVSFEQFGREFIGPLENVVLIDDDKHSGDVFYRSRHQHVAEILFRRALPSQEEKFDALAEMVAAMNVDYSSDRETFGRLIKGRGIAEIFPNVELGRLFYDRTEDASPNDPFVSHQRAVFEMAHYAGSLRLAEEHARRAFELNSHNRGIRHTQAEVARRQANSTDDPLKKEAFRRTTREKLSGDLGRLGEADLYTRARLAVDELREALPSAELTEGEKVPARFVEAVREAELAIQRGLQTYPESPEILTVDADFRDLMNQAGPAQTSLEKAFRLNPRQDWLAVRLSRRYADAHDWPSVTRVLEICLKDNPTSKAVHFELARTLMQTGGAAADVLGHLRRSFTDGDNNYEAQFWYARELFIQGQFEDAQRYFSSLHDRAPGRFRNGAGAQEQDAKAAPMIYRGRVDRLEEGYAFIRASQFPKAVFASKSDSALESWGRLKAGAQVTFTLAFSRRGARAMSIDTQ